MKTETQQTKSGKLPHWGVYVGIGLLLLILAAVLIILNGKNDEKGDKPPVVTQQGTQQPNKGEQQEQTNQNASESTAVSGNASLDNSAASTDSGNVPTESNQDATAVPTTTQSPFPTIAEDEIYEERLAAAMVIGISMQYSDFEFLGIYTASQTPMQDYMNSQGAYVVFLSEGEKLALKSVPLEAERTEKDTMDLHMPALGYATYELVDPDSVTPALLNEVKLEDMEELILESALVSIIER